VEIYTVTAGFIPANAYVPLGVCVRYATNLGVIDNYSSPSIVSCNFHGTAGSWVVDQSFFFQVSWITNDAWPNNPLPGV
jgi:hypothetical protein